MVLRWGNEQGGLDDARTTGRGMSRCTALVALALLCCALAPAPAPAADPTVVAAGNIACEASQSLLQRRRRHRRRAAARWRPQSSWRARRRARTRRQPVLLRLSGRVSGFVRPGLGRGQSRSRTRCRGRASTRRRARPATSTTSTAPARRRRGRHPGHGYYSFDLGRWHLVALNTNCQVVSCAAGSDAGALAARGPRRASHCLHARLRARAAIQLGRTGLDHSRMRRAVAGPVRGRGRRGAERATRGTTSASRRRRRAGARTRLRHPAVRGRHRRLRAGRARRARRSTARCARTRPFGVLELTLRPTMATPGGSSPEAGGDVLRLGQHRMPRRPRRAPTIVAPPKQGGRQEASCTITGTPKGDVLRGNPPAGT